MAFDYPCLSLIFHSAYHQIVNWFLWETLQDIVETRRKLSDSPKTVWRNSRFTCSQSVQRCNSKINNESSTESTSNLSITSWKQTPIYGRKVHYRGSGKCKLHKVCCQKLKGRKLEKLESPQKNEIQVARATLTEQPGEPTMRTGNKKSTTINSIMLIQAKQNAAKVKKSFLDPLDANPLYVSFRKGSISLGSSWQGCRVCQGCQRRCPESE